MSWSISSHHCCVAVVDNALARCGDIAAVHSLTSKLAMWAARMSHSEFNAIDLHVFKLPLVFRIGAKTNVYMCERHIANWDGAWGLVCQTPRCNLSAVSTLSYRCEPCCGCAYVWQCGVVHAQAYGKPLFRCSRCQVQAYPMQFTCHCWQHHFHISCCCAQGHITDIRLYACYGAVCILVFCLVD